MSSKDDKDLDFADKNRLVYVTGSLDEKKSEDIVTKLLNLDCSNHVEPIIMFIDSYGGLIDTFISIHDAMKLCRCDIATVCIGKACSAGQMLLMSGTPGKRFITPNSRVLIHQLSAYTGGKLSDIEIDATEYRRQQNQLESLVIKYTKIDAKKLKEFMTEDTYLDAQQAVELGIVDEIIVKPALFYKRIRK